MKCIEDDLRVDKWLPFGISRSLLLDVWCIPSSHTNYFWALVVAHITLNYTSVRNSEFVSVLRVANGRRILKVRIIDTCYIFLGNRTETLLSGNPNVLIW